MPKRKRALSESCCSLPTLQSRSSAALTATNLDRLQQALSPPNTARTPSPSCNTTTTLDAREKLTQYRIHVDTHKELPETLQRYVSDVILRPRATDEAPSPNAKKIVQRRRVAAQQNESTGSQHIIPYMLFAGEADMDERVEAVPHVTRKAELLLNSFFLPPAPNKMIKDTWRELSRPKPDSCLGYVSRSDAAATGCQAPFSADEESILNDYVLTKSMYMPFLTARWTTPSGAEGLYVAVSQAACDGAVIVNHLYDLYHVAYDKEPSFVDTCHFPLVGDLQYGEIWVHWRDGMDHHMELIHDFTFREEAKVQEARGVLRNIKNFALNERLASIRRALKLFATAKQKSGRYPAVPASDLCASLSELPQPAARARFPPTPSSVASSEPTKKRARVQSDDGFGG